MKYDYLIAGQGIAGTVLGFSLIEAGKSVLIVDPCKEQTTSLVAAGLFNPITGRKPNKTWLAEDLFPFLHNFYPRMEKVIGQKFFYPRPIFVPFDTVEKQNNWLSRTAEPGYPAFVKGFDKSKYKESLHAEQGGITLKQSGYINTKVLIQGFREYAQSRKAFERGMVKAEELELANDGVLWNGHVFEKAIFCEGIDNRLNPFFDWLDYRPAKGEILRMEIAEAPFEEIINRGCWMIRQEDGTFRVGSNFERSTNPTPSEKGRQQVLEKLEALTPLEYRVVDHQAGIRPATYDRRPFIGLHPDHSQLALFGGLGSKGTSLAPYFAQKFVEFLLYGSPMSPAVGLNRKKKR